MDKSFLRLLDDQMRQYAPRVVKELSIPDLAAHSLATTIECEIQQASNTLLDAIRNSSPLTPKRRLFFFEDYIIWRAEIERNLICPNPTSSPERVRQSFVTFCLVLPHLYMSFVFASEGLFDVLSKNAERSSCLHKCASFIRNNPVRALRNAIAHGNWYLTHTGSVRYWAKKGSEPSEPFVEFEAKVDDMLFYLSIVRCVAWASLLSVTDKFGDIEGGLWNV